MPCLTEKPSYRGFLYCLANICKLLSITAHVASFLLRGNTTSPRLLLCSAILSLAATVSVYKSQTQAAWTAQQRVDSALAMQITFPVISNILGQLYLPTFEQSRVSWPGFLVLSMLEGTLLLDLPPAHGLLQSAVLIPAVIYLDYAKSGSSCSAVTLSAQVQRSLLILLLGAFTTLLTGMLSCQSNNDSPVSEDDTKETKNVDTPSASPPHTSPRQEAPHRLSSTSISASCTPCSSDLQPPLTALGITLPSWLCTVLKRYEAALQSLATGVDTAAVVRVLCLPMCTYFAARVTLSRWGLKAACVSNMTHEEWLLSMVAWYMLGSNTCCVGVSQSMQQLLLQLDAARSLLTDMLPVNMLMARSLVTAGAPPKPVPTSTLASQESFDDSLYSPRPHLSHLDLDLDSSGVDCSFFDKDCWSAAGAVCDALDARASGDGRCGEPAGHAQNREEQQQQQQRAGLPGQAQRTSAAVGVDSSLGRLLRDAAEADLAASTAAAAQQLLLARSRGVHVTMSEPNLPLDSAPAMSGPTSGHHSRKWDGEPLRGSKLLLHLPAGSGLQSPEEGKGDGGAPGAYRSADQGLVRVRTSEEVDQRMVRNLVCADLVSLTDADASDDDGEGSPERGLLHKLSPRKRAQHLQQLLGSHLKASEDEGAARARGNTCAQVPELVPVGASRSGKPRHALRPLRKSTDCPDPSPEPPLTAPKRCRSGLDAGQPTPTPATQAGGRPRGRPSAPTKTAGTSAAAPAAASTSAASAAEACEPGLRANTPDPSAGLLTTMQLSARSMLSPGASSALMQLRAIHVSEGISHLDEPALLRPATYTIGSGTSNTNSGLQPVSCAPPQPSSEASVPPQRPHGQIAPSARHAGARPKIKRNLSVQLLSSRLTHALPLVNSCPDGCIALEAALPPAPPNSAGSLSTGSSRHLQRQLSGNSNSNFKRQSWLSSSALTKLQTNSYFTGSTGAPQGQGQAVTRTPQTLGQLGRGLLLRISAADPFQFIPTALSSAHTGPLYEAASPPGSNTPAAGSINQSLMATVGPAPIVVAASHPCVTLFFSDIVGFSTWAHKLPPEVVMGTLNDLYSRLDDIILNEMPSLYKVETIGDAYVMAANLLTPDPDHAATVMRFALRAQEEAAKVMRPDLDDGTHLQMRIGLHSGPIMSGIVGKIRQRFCLYGNTMNMAARTEATCPPGCIQISAATRQLALPCMPEGATLMERGAVQVKGSDQPIHMYLLTSATPSPATTMSTTAL